MRVRTLLPDEQSLQLENVEIDHVNRRVCIRVRSVAKTCVCPNCKQPSRRVHSRYERQLKDLPWQGLQVRVFWRTRRFFCDAAECSQRIFAERQESVAAPHAHRTQRLSLALRCIAIACGGEPGSRLADRLGMQIGADTLLREVRKTDVLPISEPRALGVDDWAFCKGKRYGTLICNLENGRALDLLPDRDAKSLATWLRKHDSIEIISRDRSDIYRKAANQGAPHAIQVADRFHLMKNLRDAFTRFLEGQSKQIRNAVESCNSVPNQGQERDELQVDETETLRSQTESRERRLTMFNRVVELHKQGRSMRAIANDIGINRNTVRKYLQTDEFPKRAVRRYTIQADQFNDYLLDRWTSGYHNASLLWKEIKSRGYEGSYYSVRRLVSKWRADGRGSSTCSTQKRVHLSVNQVSWLLFKRESKLSDEEVALKKAVLNNCDEIRACWQVVQRFVVMLRKCKGKYLMRWFQQARKNAVPLSIRQFAEGLKADWAAVVAGLSLKWNNGSSEGHVNRLKMIKRQMYGRANFDLLRARFLGTV